MASSAARTCSRGSWSAVAAKISASGRACSHCGTSSGRSSASSTQTCAPVSAIAEPRARSSVVRPERGCGQDQHPLAEGERAEQVDRADERIALSIRSEQPPVRRRRRQILEVPRSPSGLCPLTDSTRTSARWRSPRRGARAGPLTSSPGRSSQRRIWEAET